MHIWTSYFANLKNIPQHIVPISISLYPPKGWLEAGNLEYKDLAPTADILHNIKNGNINQIAYIYKYKEDVLDILEKDIVLKDLRELSQNQDCVLLCYEKPVPDTFYCHRQIVAKFLGIEEYKVEENINSLF